MKKIKVWSRTNPGGRKTKKPSCKSIALKRWMATEMRWNENSLSSRLRAKFADPNHREKKWPTHWLDPGTVSTAIGWKNIVSAKLRISPLCEKLASPPHSQDPARPDQCKSQPWCRQLSHPTSRTCRLQMESVWRRRRRANSNRCRCVRCQRAQTVTCRPPRPPVPDTGPTGSTWIRTRITGLESSRTAVGSGTNRIKIAGATSAARRLSPSNTRSKTRRQLQLGPTSVSRHVLVFAVFPGKSRCWTSSRNIWPLKKWSGRRW